MKFPACPQVFGSALAWFFLAFPFPAAAVGFRLPNQDPEAIARGNAFTASANNPSAIYYNPAGITQLKGQNAQAGLYFINVNSSYRAPNGSKSENKSKIQAAPQFYYTFAPTNHPYAIGVGLYVPYGLAIEWPSDTGFRSLAMEGRLDYVSLNPVGAWEITPGLSLAAGPTINVARVRVRKGIATPTDEFKFTGWGEDVGYVAGLRWEPAAKWAAGLTYHSATEINFSGYSSARPYTPREHTTARLPFPQFVRAGIAYSPSQLWNVEVDVDWADWDALKTVTFEKPSGNSPFHFNWKSTFMYSVGVTRQLPNRFWIAAGYFYSENSVPDQNFNPLVPDTDQHVASIGVGQKLSKWSWAMAYQLLTGPWRTVHGSQPSALTGESADGRYRLFNQAVNVSINYHF